MGPLIATLQHFEENHSSNERNTITDCLLKRQNAEFTICLILFGEIFSSKLISFPYILSNSKAATFVLQIPDNDLSQAVELSQALKSDIKKKLGVESI